MSVGEGALWTHWARVDGILRRALALDPSERRAFVRARCADDPELLRVLNELLDASEMPDTRLEGSRDGVLDGALADEDESGDPLRPGDLVGRYRIVTRIGRGGMATVYQAERADGTFSQRVALKVLRRGLDTEDAVRRFEDEREILSELAHPNIARIVDGGATNDGRPFLAMELVTGRPVTDWAASRALATDERLELFLQAAEAVRFAHSRLVVHRDIKPSNVLVDEEGRVRLLDFGIAKILTPDDRGTRTVGAVPLTPAYASPEQARGERVSTASDVYQLGRLLTAVITARAPSPGRGLSMTDPSSPTDGTRTSTDRVPGAAWKPSRIAERAGDPRLAARLRGDVDTIVAKATREDPRERYASVEALIGDVRRHLDGHPVRARPASLGYRLRKLHGRNRWLAPTAAVVVTLTVGYVMTLSVQAGRLEEERNRAQASAGRAGALRSLLVGQFEAANPWAGEPGRARDITMVEALQGAADQAREELSGQPLLLAGILSDVGGVHQSLDLRPEAIALIEEAMALRDGAGAAGAEDQRDDMGLLSSLFALESRHDSARALAERRLLLERNASPRSDERVALALGGLARLENAAGRFAAADTLLGMGIALLREEETNHEALARQLEDRAVALQGLADLAAAEASVREAIEIRRRLVEPDHPTVAVAEEHLAQVLYGAGRLDESVALHRTARTKLEASLGPDHSTTIATINNLALVLAALEDFEGAAEAHRTLLTRQRRLADGDESRGVAVSLQNLATVLLRTGSLVEADSMAVRAGTLLARLDGPGHYTVGFSLLTRSEIALRRGDGRAASSLADSALSVLRAALPEGHYATAVARCRRAAGHLQIRDEQAARREAAEALARLRASAGAPERFVRECTLVAGS